MTHALAYTLSPHTHTQTQITSHTTLYSVLICQVTRLLDRDPFVYSTTLVRFLSFGAPRQPTFALSQEPKAPLFRELLANSRTLLLEFRTLLWPIPKGAEFGAAMSKEKVTTTLVTITKQ